MSKVYSSNLTLAQWELLESLIPPALTRWSSPKSRDLGGTQRHFLRLDTGVHSCQPTSRLPQLADRLHL